MRSTSRSYWWPRNTSVTWSWAAGRRRIPSTAPSSSSRQRASGSRTSSGRSSARNSRTRGLFRRSVTSNRRGAAVDEAAEQVKRDGGRAVPDLAPRAGDVERPGDPLAAALGHAEAHAPDRLVLRRAVRAGDPGEADPEVRVEAVDRARRERLGDLFRHGAVALDQGRIDAQQRGL